MALALDLGALKRRLSREGAQSGAITASLLWNDPSDLDLHAWVKCNGKHNTEHIFYGHKKAAGGYLDVDMNVNSEGNNFSLEPVENIFWTTSPGGEYRITVTNAGTKSSDTNWGGKFKDPHRSISFKVFLNKDDDMQEFEGVWQPGCAEIECFKFSVEGSGGTDGGGNYIVFPPEEGKTTFKELCDKHVIAWKTGGGFYAVARKEKIQAAKEMLLHNIAEDKFTVGQGECRKALGWPEGELNKGPGDILQDHRLFVQSTSGNRVIPPGTHVLFEVDAEEYAKHRKTSTIQEEKHTTGTAGMSAAAKATAKAAAKPEAKAAAAKAEAKAKAVVKGKAKAGPKAGDKRKAEPEPKAKAKAKAKARGAGANIAGKKIVFTGTLSTPRATATAAATAAGASVLSAVSGNMDILVAGPGAGAKIQKAEELGKEVWDEDKFKAAVGL